MLNPASRSRKPNPVAMFCRLQILQRVVDEKGAEREHRGDEQDLDDDAAHDRVVPGRRPFRPRCRRRLLRSATSGRDQRIGIAYISPPLRPQIVEAAIQLQRRLGADIALEDLAVIADRLDRVIGPFLVETERLAHAGGRAEHPLDVGVLAL